MVEGVSSASSAAVRQWTWQRMEVEPRPCARRRTRREDIGREPIWRRDRREFEHILEGRTSPTSVGSLMPERWQRRRDVPGGGRRCGRVGELGSGQVGAHRARAGAGGGRGRGEAEGAGAVRREGRRGAGDAGSGKGGGREGRRGRRFHDGDTGLACADGGATTCGEVRSSGRVRRGRRLVRSSWRRSGGGDDGSSVDSEGGEFKWKRFGGSRWRVMR
jgi:hypothetical protein